jgi:uncharacterized membrane protein YphA (DoxX/SURF4 family)
MFRFCFVYLGLYCLCTQVITVFGGILTGPTSDLSGARFLRPLVDRVAADVFGLAGPLVHAATASSDRRTDWVLVFVLMMIASAVTVIWSVSARGRTRHPALFTWSRLFLRFALAGQLLLYGVAKIVLAQMPSPPLSTLMTPFGELTPMGVLWSSVGASPAYEVVVGCTETIGGILLLIPATTALGALVSSVALTQVFVLNMTYDVPVKIMSCHLLVIGVFLLAPDLRRLADVLLSLRAVEPVRRAPIFGSRRANACFVVAQISLALWMAIPIVQSGIDSRDTHGDTRDKPALYGMWEVESFSADGRTVPLSVTEDKLWRRVFFEYAGEMKYQRMDDAFGIYLAAVDMDSHMIELRRYGNSGQSSTLAIALLDGDRLRMSGVLEGQGVAITLRKVDTSDLPLKGRGFHWVQDYPYNPDSR